MKKIILIAVMTALVVLFGCASGTEPEETKIVAPGENNTVTAPDDTSADMTDTSADTSDETTAAEEKTPERLAAEKIMSEMTIDEKIGQLFFSRIPTDYDTAISDMEKYQPGGYVFFASEFENRTPETMKTYTDALKWAAKIVPLLAVDEEGGTVTRISRFKQYRAEKFLSPRELMAGGTELVASDTREKCSLISSLGLNLNLAPVADISTDPNDFIYYRSAGDLGAATDYVTTYVIESLKAGVGSALKHFPGYGNNVDTHTGIAVDKRSADTFRASDFLPFKAGIEAGCGIVMVSHNIVECFDKENPASLSAEVHRVLREELSFDGVITTDDLAMQAVTDSYGSGEAAVLAIEAGNDLICCSDLSVKYEAVKSAYESGRISLSRIEESVLRILEYKVTMGLLSSD